MTGSGDFSDDLIVETLSRLPVKSLMRFKCVCKSWYGLVKDPNFIYRHLKRDDNMRLMVHCTCKNEDDTDPFNALITYFSIFPDKTLTDLYFQDLEPAMNGYKNCPYDGIFVLMKNTTLIDLWNVSMNEYRVVPECRVHLPCCTGAHSTDYGLGLDPVTNDFKLVLIISSWDKNRRWTPDFSPAAVYNFTTNSWRDLGSFPVSHDYRFEGSDNVYLNGFCYWVVSLPDYSKEILSFNMSGEVFQLIKGPNIPQLQDDKLPARTWLLGIYDDSLFTILKKIGSFF